MGLILDTNFIIAAEREARPGVHGRADAIVTRNVRDVRHGELAFPHLQILTPAEFLKTI